MNQHSQAQDELTRGTESGDSAFDVVIVGGGAAGLSAALVLGRARRRVAVVDAGRPRNAPAAHMQGFLGFDGMPPSELLAAGRGETTRYGVRHLPGTVSQVEPEPCRPGNRRHFAVTLNDGTLLRTRRVLVTTGLHDVLPDIPGLIDRWGRDLLHCPYCHGYEVRDQPLGVLAGAPTPLDDSLAHAHLVRQWSGDVVFFSNGLRLGADQREQLVARAIGVVDGAVRGLVVEEDQLVAVELEDGRVVPRQALFVRPEFASHDTLLAQLGCATNPHGWTVVDPTGATSIPGVWAAGNAVNPRAQVITAAGEGSAAAISINNDLVAEDLPLAVAHFRLGLPVT